MEVDETQIDASPHGVSNGANVGAGDFTDSKGKEGSSASMGGSSIPHVPICVEAEKYLMNHSRRGFALILNHKDFNTKLNLKTRNGTDVDAANLKRTFAHLGFEVKLKKDLTVQQIDKSIEELAARTDHTDFDCLVVCVLSHGEMGTLYAADNPYKPQMLWEPFAANKCPSLAGKPKLFFIQACQGDQLDPGAEIALNRKTSTDNVDVYKIPVHADFLIAYSTIPGYFSWRNTTNGSWFVQALCHVLNAYGTEKDLLSLMTIVCRLVAFHFESNTPNDLVMHRKKQIPCITTMLTRDIVFTPK